MQLGANAPGAPAHFPGEIDVPVRYVGFEIPNRFVIGYGLDFAERYRNLPYVGVLDPDLIGPAA